MTSVELYCSAERRVVGSVSGVEGTAISAATVRTGFTPAAPEYASIASRAADGVALLCPRCGNPLLFSQPQGEGEAARGVYAVPGAVRFAPESGPR